MIKTTERTKCILTDSEDLVEIVNIKDFPVFMGCVSAGSDPNEDIKTDMIWTQSKSSGSVQLKLLLELSLLYNDHHNPGSVGKIWEEHHRNFHEFIGDLKNNQTCLEIGGSTGNLLNHFLQSKSTFDYNIIEPSNQNFIDKRVSFIQGFYESYKFNKKYDSIIHSHVFEHIYNPLKFLNKIHTDLNAGGYQYISIPNMKTWITNGYINALNFEHTYYIDENVLNYLLRKTGFEIVDQRINDHSIFTKAVKTTNFMETQLDISYAKSLYIESINALKYDTTSINTAVSNRPFYIFGAHVFAQNLIAFGLKTDNVVCLLDNDKQKHGKRLYGTDLIVHAPSKIQEEKTPIVVVRAGVYTKEICEQLKTINKNVIII